MAATPPDALIEMFAQASARQGEALRQAVSEATLKALQGREMTLQNIRQVIETVTQAASTGLAQSAAPPPDVEALLGSAVAGMDAALLQAVEAHRRALQGFVEQGAALQQGPLKQALDELQRMEEVFLSSVTQAAQGAGAPLQGPWQQVLQGVRSHGTDTGTQAGAAVQQLMSQAQAALRGSQVLGLKAGQALMESYAALVSGVLIGMSEGLRQGGAATTPAGKGGRPHPKK